MEDQLGTRTDLMVLFSARYCLSAPLKGREWFWGVVLNSLLVIGCVESNPGPRSNEAPMSEQPRRHYGSIESRHGGQGGQEETPAEASGCWPFRWWCRGEPMSNETLIEKRANRDPGGVQCSLAYSGNDLSFDCESEDDELLVDNRVGQVRLINQQSEIDLLKEQATILNSKLEQEMNQRQKEREEYEATIVNYEKIQEESVRFHNNLHAKLDETIQQKALLEQQLRDLAHKNEKIHTEENAERLKKELQRRKQLEEDLERERQQLKLMTAITEQEILQRQQLEQEMRLWQLNKEAELKEQKEEDDLQRTQLLQAVEIEVQKRQDMKEQLENVMKQRQEEKQQRVRLEDQLQEEIQARRELEAELKKADLHSQLLEQQLRQELSQIELVFRSDENMDAEVVSLNDREDISCTDTSGSDAAVSGEIFDKTEEKEETGDIENGEELDEERWEIRRLLLEEFQRLGSKQDQEEASTDITKDVSRSPNSEEIDRDSAQGQGHLEDVMGEDLNTNLAAINMTDSLQNEKQGADFEEINVDWHTLLTEGSGDERTGPKNEESISMEAEALWTDVIIRRKGDIKSSLSEEEIVPAEYGEKRKGILFRGSSFLDLEGAVEEQKTYGSDTVTETESMSQMNDYSDVISKIINFQGKDVTVESLIGELILPETKVLLDEIKTSLSTEIKPVIGCACGHSAGPYIARTLQRNALLHSDVLKQKTSKLPPVFAISGMTEEELKEIVGADEKICCFDGGSGIENSGPRFVLLNDVTAARDFKDLCNRARNLKRIHWLAKQPDGFEWRGSKGNMDVVQQYIDFSKSRDIPSITNLKGETIIVSGGRGEGKSTYLTHLESEIKETYPDTWIIRLKLNEQPSLKEKCDLTESRVIELLSSAAGLETSPSASIGKALLTNSLLITGKVVVLIDEIDIINRDKIHDLLRVLKNMKTVNLVISVDSCISKAIENSLSTLAFNLKPLTNGELQLLIKKLWTTDVQHDDDDDSLSDKFSAELLHVIGKHSISGNLPTPLHITMASHIFEREYKSYLSTKVINLPERLDSVELYEMFIAWGFGKCKNNEAGSAEVWDSYLAHITGYSMRSLFPEDSFANILPLEESTRQITYEFPPLCRSLKEYLTAKWFAENYQSHRSFIEGKYFEAELQTMWEIFERILVKQSELHLSVLAGDIQRLMDLLDSGLEVNCLDKGARTALHISVLKGKYHADKADDQCVRIAPLLMEHDANISIVDGILGWTALRYADMTASWTIVDRLLQDEAADISDMSCTKHKLHDQNFLQELLTSAAVNGYTYLAAFILDTGVDINMPLHSTRYSHQQYALVHIASENGHISLLKFLLEKGADANACIWDNSTPLHLACKQGNKECVVALLQNSACTYQSNKKGDTPLHEAVRSGNSDIVQILLSKDADAELCNKDGDTPLHVACKVNHLMAVSHLLDRDKYRDNCNQNGDRPLHCAIRGGHTALVKYILKLAKASVRDRNRNGYTSVHLAAEVCDILILDYLLQVIPDVNVRTDGGDTPLHIASLHGKTDAVTFLLKNGADSAIHNKHGNTALHLASVRGHIDTMKILMESNAQVDATNEEGNTPLHLVCYQGQAEGVRCLVQHKANPNVKNREKNTPLHLAAIKGDIGVITSLIEANCDVNLTDKHGNTILHQCVRNGKSEIVKLLVHTGHCHLHAKNSDGDTPVIIAARFGFSDVVECLVGHGADIDCPTQDGDAPIHLAVKNEDLELVTTLCRLGADVNMRSSRGKTALHMAVYRDNELMIRKLVQHGASPSLQDSSGCTPFDVAVQLSSKDVIRRAL